MRSRWNLPVLIAYMVGSLAVLGLLVARVGVTPPWSHPYTLTANFQDAEGILVNNEVYMNGVKVGRVTDVAVRGGTAAVTLVIEDGHALPIHTDASAEVRKKNLLGETYIDLQRGSLACSTCNIESGGVITIDHTVPITAIDQVLAIFDPATVQRVQLLINALGEGTNGRGNDMNSSAASAASLVQSLDAPAVQISIHRQQLHDIVMELQKLYDMLALQRAQVADALVTWNQVMAQVAAQDQQLGDTIVQADQLVTSLDQLLAGEGGNIQATLAALPSSLKQANTFLEQTNGVLAGLAPYRGAIHDIFPHLASSFADTDVNGQHFWSVYAVNCNSDCGSSGAAQPAPAGSASTAAFWAAESGAP